MKGVLLKQLQVTGVVSPGLMNRLLSSATSADCRPASIVNDGAIRGMATGADIMCGTSTKNEESLEREDKRPTISSSSEEPKVVAMPSPHSFEQKWWHPDPATGTWVPEGYEGQVTTSTDVMKSPSRITRIRAETTTSLEGKRWWTSMEELPDMERADTSSTSCKRK